METKRRNRSNTTSIGGQTINTTSTTSSNEQGDKGQTGGNTGNKDINTQSILKENLVVPKTIIVENDGADITTAKVKTARTPRKAKSKETGISTNDISMLISGMFSLVSLKAGEHWNVSQDEANTISKPLENILRKMDLLEKVSNISDGAMLVFAVSSITIPRLLISNEMMKASRKLNAEQIKKGGIIKNGTTATTVTNTGTGKTVSNSSNTESSKNDNAGIEEAKQYADKLNNPLYQQILE